MQFLYTTTVTLAFFVVCCSFNMFYCRKAAQSIEVIIKVKFKIRYATLRLLLSVKAYKYSTSKIEIVFGAIGVICV